MGKITPETLKLMKRKGEKISSITSYDYSTARIVDEAGIDFILVGDSAAMVMLGYPTTHAINMTEMKIFTSAVARGVKNALIVGDLPFGSYQASIEEGVKNACELIKCGANAVKIEGGSDYIVELTERLTTQGIPVMSHLGFTPQFLNALGGYKVQAKGLEQAEFILKQALKLQQAGAFAVVMEMISEEAGKYFTEKLDIPVIGIGAGRYTDGQILVIDDILGKYKDFTPKFSKRYADLNSVIGDAVQKYIDEVKTKKFPTEEHIFAMKEEEKEKLKNASYINC
ncbi:MAG: 3-methyl-2-oxobutanoate hydroxymethyltransferase [Candidatus Gastranaerophilales bacterium]|nr:3-methyl-2-oxobutanoate hydroxymethyltransferase [Candidatus Gastranaerophilales bacterium]